MNEQAGGQARAAVDVDLFLYAALILMLLVGVEGFFIGWALNKAAALTSAITLQPDHLVAFMKWLALILVPFFAFNAGVGVWIAREISTPLIRMRAAMNAVSNGDLEHEFALPEREILQDYTKDCHKMLQTLRRLIYRDRQSVLAAGALLKQCQALIARRPQDGPIDQKKAAELLTLARSELSVVNHHFMKGRKETS